MAEDVVRYHDIEDLKRDVREINAKVDIIGGLVDDMHDDVKTTRQDLEQLKKRFEELMEDRKRAEEYAHATTELVRVRQDIDKDFREYGQIRKTMIGVLQATDLALVKKSTISNVSEELMISTPNYWLAPCLIAISAWISNDRDLADRAIREAMKRDEQRTALTMALICRRNKRTNACYEWLNIYFSKIDVNSFTAGGYTFVDAYINGVFGPDEKHICSDYVDKWLQQIKAGGTDFEEKQNKQWEAFCENRTTTHDELYTNLQEHTDEIDRIKNYTNRVYSSYDIQKEFSDINDAEIDIDQIRANVDDNLVRVINNYADDEQDLRLEEACYTIVKNSKGKQRYEDVRKRLIRERENAQKQKFSLAERMVKAILNKDNTSISEKKTAVSLLKPYINKGYTQYLNEAKPLFPNTITLNLGECKLSVDKQPNIEALKSQYKTYLDSCKEKEIAEYKEHQGKKNLYKTIGCGVGAFLTLVMMLIPVTIIFLLACAWFGYKYYKTAVNPAEYLKKMDEKYNQLANKGYDTIFKCITEWNNINYAIGDFESNAQKYLAA